MLLEVRQIQLIYRGGLVPIASIEPVGSLEVSEVELPDQALDLLQQFNLGIGPGIEPLEESFAGLFVGSEVLPVEDAGPVLG